ncbi:MAG: putative lipid II flippase FtsW [Actinomycetota bacterium]
MASRVIQAPRHLRLVRATDRTPAQVAASRARVVVLLIGSAAALTAIGLIMVLSASSVSSYARYGSSFLFFKRQAMYVAIGALCLLLTSRMRYGVWQRLALPLLGIAVALLLLVLHPGAGTVAGGSARWIALGPVTIQPSEIAKLAVIAFAATVLTRKANLLHRPLHLLLPLVPVVAIVCGLIMLQPDMGTTLIVASSVLVLVFAAGARLKHLFVTAFAGGGLGLLLIMGAGYRKARLFSFLHPQADPTNRGYQLLQSLIALGSGGWFGVGLGQSRQKWMYVPNAHTDFIFSILGEELGLIGELVVLALFTVLLYSGVRIALHAPDRFGRLLAAGIVGWLGIQTLVNLGAVTGLLPVTGVPLPFVSFGGSSLVVTLAAVGILVNIGRSARTGRSAPRSTPRKTTARKSRPKTKREAPSRKRRGTTVPAPVWGSSGRVRRRGVSG